MCNFFVLVSIAALRTTCNATNAASLQDVRNRLGTKQGQCSCGTVKLLELAGIKASVPRALMSLMVPS